MKKKALAFALVLCMVIAMLPVSVFAAPVSESAAPLTAAAVGELAPAAIEPNAKSYSVSLSGSSHGTVELLVDSPAQSGSEVYFLADPDDSYLAEVYVDGIDSSEVFYLGLDTWGFIMPANKVTLQVEFVAAEGEEHSISLYGADGGGQCQLSRTSAKEHESVLLAVLPEHDYDFEPTELVWAFGADIYYLLEQDGIHYYEIFMGNEDVKIILCYNVRGAHKITKDFWGGKLELESDYAVTNKEVVFSVTPPDDYIMEEVQVITEKGSIPLELTYLGEEQGSYTYSFIMPPCAVKVKLHCHAETWNITVNHNSGGVAYADRTTSPKSLGIRVTCTPDEGYRVASVTGNVPITDKGNNLYSFVMPEHDVTIDVTFKPIYNPVTVTVETGIGGTASVDVTEAKLGDTVTLTATPDEGYRVARITGVNGLTDNGDGTYTFTMPDEAVELKVLFLRHENPFLDVNETHFFYTPVLWAVEEGITSGMTPDTFGPFAVCNRAQVVTFLWRYAGSPEPTTTENPFTDVPAEGWFTKPVLWALENGITQGVSPTEFGPNLACNRAQVVTFLWRLMQEPQPGLTEHPFTDVQAGSWYEAPVLWALENGITTGATTDTFNPVGQCQRAQVVTFLYRTAQLPVYYDIYCEFDAEKGTVTLSQENALAGETVTATVIPAEGYRIESVTCLEGIEITQVSDTEYTFVMPEQDVVLQVAFAEIPVEPTEPEPTDPTEPSEPDPTDPTEPEEPVKTYELDLRDNGNGKVAYVDGKTTAAPGESIFFYAVPNPGYELTNVGIFNPDGAIDVSQIQLYEHGNDLYELIMIDHDIIMTCHFTPIA